jgi:hypothetical protein
MAQHQQQRFARTTHSLGLMQGAKPKYRSKTIAISKSTPLALEKKVM